MLNLFEKCLWLMRLLYLWHFVKSKASLIQSSLHSCNKSLSFSQIVNYGRLSSQVMLDQGLLPIYQGYVLNAEVLMPQNYRITFHSVALQVSWFEWCESSKQTFIFYKPKPGFRINYLKNSNIIFHHLYISSGVVWYRVNIHNYHGEVCVPSVRDSKFGEIYKCQGCGEFMSYKSSQIAMRIIFEDLAKEIQRMIYSPDASIVMRKIKNKSPKSDADLIILSEPKRRIFKWVLVRNNP